jgi:adenine deaminase
MGGKTERQTLMNVALGEEPADLVIRNGKMVNVLSGEVYKADVAIKGNRIAVVGDLNGVVAQGAKVIDARDRYLLPGFVDAHIHIGGSHLSMTRWAETFLANGTTAIATDCYDIGVIAGIKGIRFALDEALDTPLKVLFVVPVVAYLQQKPFGSTDKIGRDDLMEMLNWRETVGINEPPPDPILRREPVMLELFEKTLDMGKVVVGHASETFGKRLNAYLTMGPYSDHECLTGDEAVSKLRLGMSIMMREGSAAVDVAQVVKAITEHGMAPHHFMFCTDERDPVDLYNQGHLNFTVKKAIREGLNPVAAIQIATINAARYFRRDHEIGSITAGKLADMIITDGLTTLQLDTVIAGGQIVVEKGSYVGPVNEVSYPEYMKGILNFGKKIELSHLAIKTDTKGTEVTVRVAHAMDGTLLSKRETANLGVKNGEIQPDAKRDITKMVVLERHNATGQIGRAFVSGFGLKRGAFAQSYHPVNENVVVLGTNDRDMLVAVHELEKMNGGFVVVEGGRVKASLRLPILGVLSDEPLEKVKDGFESVTNAIHELGSPFKSPILSLAFMAMAYGIPTYKLSEYGLVDVEKGELVDLVID